MLKMPKNNLIADNFLIQFFAHAILKYSASVKESTLTVYKGNMTVQKMEGKNRSPIGRTIAPSVAQGYFLTGAR